MFSFYDTPGRGGIGWTRDSFYASPGFSWASQRHYARPSWSYTAWVAAVCPRPELPFGGSVECHHYLGVSMNRITSFGKPGATSYFVLDIPFSYLTLLTALPPALWLRGFLRRRRANHARGFPVAQAPPTSPRSSLPRE